MKASILTLLTTLALTAPLANADHDRPERGFAAFLQAVAAAAEQGRAAHEAQKQFDAHEQGAYYGSGGYQQHGDHHRYAGYQDYGPLIYDISGEWVFGNNVNRFQRTHQGYYVIPVGRGRGVHYVEIGDNLYQDANGTGTYEVIDDYYMVWRSNDQRNRVIELFRR